MMREITMTLPAIIHTQAYRKAFDLYLCKGVPIELSLKAALQEHPTTHYIWRTKKGGELAPFSITTRLK